MDITEYHKLPNVGSSFLKAFARSPLHAWSAYIDPEREQTDSKAFRIGRAWHCAVFEPNEFAGRYADDHTESKVTTRAKLLGAVMRGELALASLTGIPDDLPKTSKAGRQLYEEAASAGKTAVPVSDLEWIDAEVRRIGGREVLLASELGMALRMAGIARSLPISRMLFDQLADLGRAEVSILDTDPATGVPIKIRPDYLVEPCQQFPHGLIVDGKTTTDASKSGFGRAVWTYDYGLQAAFYSSVMQRAFGTSERPAFVWLAQEKSRPHAAQYFIACGGPTEYWDDDDGLTVSMDAGSNLLAHWDARIAEMMPRVAECMSTGRWPGYPETVETLALPAWAERQIEDAEPDAEVKL